MIHKYGHRIRKNICVIKKRGYISVCFMDNPRFPCYHWSTWFQWVILDSSSTDISGTPSFPPAAVIPGDGGGLHPGFCQCWNLDRTCPVRAKRSGQKPPTFSQPSFGYDSNILSAGRTVGWMTGGADISSCDDVQILSRPLLLSL